MNNYDKIVDEINSVEYTADIKSIVNLINTSKTIFALGNGRSGLISKALANRLLHLGFNVHSIGEITCPKVKPNDLLIVFSKTLNNENIINNIKQSIKCDAKVLIITSDGYKKACQYADEIIHIKCSNTSQPMGTLFEQSSLIISDSLVLDIMNHKKYDTSVLSNNHANIE